MVLEVTPHLDVSTTTIVAIMMMTISINLDLIIMLLVTAHLDVSSAASLLYRQGLEGCAGEALMPGHLAAHAELVAAAVAGSAHILTPGRYPAFERCQALKQCDMFSCTAARYD